MYDVSQKEFTGTQGLVLIGREHIIGETLQENVML